MSPWPEVRGDRQARRLINAKGATVTPV